MGIRVMASEKKAQNGDGELRHPAGHIPLNYYVCRVTRVSTCCAVRRHEALT